MMQLNFIYAKVNQRIIELKSKLKGFNPFVTDVLLAGSLRTGLYSGPKKAQVSGNYACPYPYVIEADLRIVFKEKTNILDANFIDRLKNIIHPDFQDVGEIYHWHRKVPVVNFYSYDHISSDLGFEWEIALQQEPYLDLSEIWRQSLSDDEFVWHKNLRAALSKSDISHDELYDLKDRQRQEARWRYISNHAINQLIQDEHLNFSAPLPFTGSPKGPAIELIEYWKQGKKGMRCLDRPIDFITPEVRDSLKRCIPDDDYLLLENVPPNLKWVNLAQQIQNSL